MTEGHDRDRLAPEAQLRTLYRELAQEHTPPELDAAVLAAARREKLQGSARSGRWLRPLALAASIGLCLAVVLRLTGTPHPAGPAEVVPEPLPEAVHKAAVESWAQKMGDAYREKSGITPAAAALRSTAEASTGSAAQAAAPAANFAEPSAPSSCTESERNAPETWLACIETLDSVGNDSLAAAERELLLRAYPGYGRPAD
jgi:hypothetical protein